MSSNLYSYLSNSPEGPRFRMKKRKGELLTNVYRSDIGYIYWILEKEGGFPTSLIQVLKKLLELKGEEVPFLEWYSTFQLVADDSSSFQLTDTLPDSCDEYMSPKEKRALDRAWERFNEKD